ncbi:MAG: ice-binding family protein, partial [Bacteroidales bacterium]|nr:ice-binding family protein [Bacteroidales bacterium]
MLSLLLLLPLFSGCFSVPPTKVAVTGVTLDQATITLTAEGATGTLVATVAPADATDKSVTWSSSAPTVATVVDGVVTPLTAGTTTITVTTVDGCFTATCAVTVTAAANPTAPVLGEAGRFVILASQKVTTTVGSAISNGDIGIIDQARSYYEGFTEGALPGQFDELTNGLSYAYDDDTGQPLIPVPTPYASITAFIDQVRTDLGIAYTFLAADPNPTAPTQVCPIELGGKTLTRGVYKTAENV